MSESVIMLNEDLEILDLQFYLVMDRYFHALINYYMSESPDDHRKVEAIEAQLNDIYKKTFILASRIEKSIDVNDAKNSFLDEKIGRLKIDYDREEKLLDITKDADLAAKPFKKEMKKDMITTYFYAGYYSIAILLGSYFIYKKLKS